MTKKEKPTTAKPTTAIARSTIDRIYIRDADLVDELIGELTFTEMILFHLTGRRPGRTETAVLDAVLVTLMEHGITPSVIATRLIYYSSPDSLQSSVAAGLLGVGSTFIGTMEGCLGLIEEMLQAQEGIEERARAIADRHREERRPVHGFGHPQHKPDDPRTPKLFDVAERAGVKGDHIAALKALSREVDRAFGRHLTINATGATAALLGEIGIPREVVRGIAVISRSAGLVGHVLEESRMPAGGFIWHSVDEAIKYSADRGRQESDD